MTNGFERVEAKKAEDANKRRKLDEEHSSIKEERIEDYYWWSDKKRGRYINSNTPEGGS